MGISLRVISTMADDCEKSLEIAAIAAATVTVVVASVVRSRKKRRRTMWVRPMFRRRSQYGAYELLMAELRHTDQDKYRGFVRLTHSEFDQILSIVRQDISGTRRGRLPIPADVRSHLLQFRKPL
jgi:hypothetical protein